MPLFEVASGIKNGERSSVGRAQDCDSCGRGFKPRRSPRLIWVNAPVAQLDRASDFESVCRGFESLQAYFITATYGVDGKRWQNY